ncbi:MAG: sigma-70 family RNA polymerase sigma factor [Myxococcales bacterium]|nr:sigma-70 family RNA polymerase sigma factor [Myxococcales bacterium]
MLSAARCPPLPQVTCRAAHLRVTSPSVTVADALPQQQPSLLERVAGGDADAVRELVARYGGLVWSCARRFEPWDAEDAVQEIFLDLWKHAARFDPTIASESTFIFIVARRRLIDRRRGRDRRPQVSEQSIPEVADHAVGPERSAEAGQAARALDQLRPEQRDVLILATCHGLSHGEIAARTGLPLGTVKAHARRGLIAVRAALVGPDPGETR